MLSKQNMPFGLSNKKTVLLISLWYVCSVRSREEISQKYIIILISPSKWSYEGYWNIWACHSYFWPIVCIAGRINALFLKNSRQLLSVAPMLINFFPFNAYTVMNQKKWVKTIWKTPKKHPSNTCYVNFNRQIDKVYICLVNIDLCLISVIINDGAGV